jgi:hypothetical protein
MIPCVGKESLIAFTAGLRMHCSGFDSTGTRKTVKMFLDILREEAQIEER